MSEDVATYTVAPGRNGHGVEKSVPAVHRATRTLLPLSWFRREIDITMTGGESLAGTLLDTCPAGAIILCRLSRQEATRRVVSWDHVLFVDLKED